MSNVYMLMKYIGDLTELKDAYNTHYGLSSGDAAYWADYQTSPIYPVNEQPESDNFYLLYNFTETHPPNGWWWVNSTIAIQINTNNVKLLTDCIKAIRQGLGDYDFAAKRVNKWAFDNNVDGQPINFIRYTGSEFVQPQEQENGVYSTVISLEMSSVDC